MTTRRNAITVGLCILLGSIHHSAWAVDADVQVKEFNAIFDFAVAKDNSLWFLDHFGFNPKPPRILRLSPNGTLIKPNGFGDSSAENRLSSITLAADDSIWALTTNATIQHYSVSGSLISQFGVEWALSAGIFYLKVAADGSLWAISAVNENVLHFKADGSLIAKIGSKGTDAGQFNNPRHIALAPDSSVWVSDGVKYLKGSGSTPTMPLSSNNYRLQHFNADGRFINQFVTETSKDEYDTSFAILGLDIASDGSLWVANKASFKHFKPDGSLIENISSYGFGTSFAEATNITLAADDSVWTLSEYNDRPNTRFLRHLKPNGDILAQYRNKPICTTEYDDQQHKVYLWDVAVTNLNTDKTYGAGTIHYDAVLQLQNGRYNLLTAKPSNASESPCSSNEGRLYYDVNSGILTIPGVQVNKRWFYASLKNSGNYAFSLESAFPLF